jgi:hypothetical protein
MDIFAACVSTTKTIHGATNLTHQSFTEPLTVNGTLEGERLNLTTLTVHGSLWLKNSLIKGDLIVKGFAMLDDVIVEGNTEIRGGIALNNCRTKDIIASSNKDSVKVEISGDTKIDGYLRFLHNNGTVQISEKTTITNGIMGGSLNDSEPVKKTGPIINGVEKKRPH